MKVCNSVIIYTSRFGRLDVFLSFIMQKGNLLEDQQPLLLIRENLLNC